MYIFPFSFSFVLCARERRGGARSKGLSPLFVLSFPPLPLHPSSLFSALFHSFSFILFSSSLFFPFSLFHSSLCYLLYSLLYSLLQQPHSTTHTTPHNTPHNTRTQHTCATHAHNTCAQHTCMCYSIKVPPPYPPKK